MAHRMAIASDHIRADVIEANEFMDLVRHYRVRGVPKVIINDRVTFEGLVPEAAFVDRVLSVAGGTSAG